MYLSRRRRSWGGCFSTQVFARQGVLPGCACVMFCLQYAMLTPFDPLFSHAMHMHRSLHVCADDIAISVIAPTRNVVSSASEVLRLLARVLNHLGLSPAKNKMPVSFSIPR
eukprot:2760819-Pyramimonas_sp.AAC.1